MRDWLIIMNIVWHNSLLTVTLSVLNILNINIVYCMTQLSPCSHTLRPQYPQYKYQCWMTRLSPYSHTLPGLELSSEWEAVWHRGQPGAGEETAEVLPATQGERGGGPWRGTRTAWWWWWCWTLCAHGPLRLLQATRPVFQLPRGPGSAQPVPCDHVCSPRLRPCHGEHQGTAGPVQGEAGNEHYINTLNNIMQKLPVIVLHVKNRNWEPSWER